ncbi:hypothetical protein SAMN04489724_4207 [Algoriphagus locisalis]|uniref:Uncharacterized protein n=1 Tax=Algoriphagus locisalis TaxID=305507 RepID=A0A1I7DNR7_9BACT|nr:hypothetical protein [Algoriphagus locisalis]SFU13265.1 hypothetical protein SAMN04489724_4207 [Algoriphagus locisalis]
MRKRASILILFASVILITSCKAYRNPKNLNPKYPIESPELEDEIPGLQNLLRGDKIKVAGKDLRMSYLLYSGVEQGNLSGELWKEGGKKLKEPKAIRIPLDQIDYIRVRRKSIGATLAWTLGLGVAATVGMTIVLADVYGQIGPDEN